MTDAPVYVVCWTKHCESGRKVLKYVRIGGSASAFTEQRRFAWSTADKDRAQAVADTIRGGRVVTMRKALPKPKVHPTLSGGEW